MGIYDGVFFFCIFVYVTVCIGGYYVEGIYCDNFCSVSKVHCLCECYGDTQAGEAAGPDGDMSLLNLVRLPVEAVQEAADCRKNFCAVPDGCRKSGFSKVFFADGDCNRTYSTGCFNS